MDLGKAVAGAAAAAHIGRRSRSRWPFAVGGLILAGLATAAILSNETIRAKIAGGVEAMRERIAAMRSTDYDELDIDQDEPIAFDAAATAPITETSPYSEGSTADATADYPSGLGSNGHEDGIPAFEEPSTTPAADPRPAGPRGSIGIAILGRCNRPASPTPTLTPHARSSPR